MRLPRRGSKYVWNVEGNLASCRMGPVTNSRDDARFPQHDCAENPLCRPYIFAFSQSILTTTR